MTSPGAVAQSGSTNAPTHHLTPQPLASVIIPVWRDDEALLRTLQHLHSSDDVEVIVAGVLGEEWRYEHMRHRASHWVAARLG